MIQEAGRMNPGLWVEHSRSTGVNARLIAERCDRLDPEAACVMGMLHDIGRRGGRFHMRHTTDGYRFLMEHGFDDAAAVCLTHSFPAPRMDTFMGEIDILDDEYAFLKAFVVDRPYTDYDRLIQLCDAVSVPEGGVVIEKRLLDVAMRYGVNDAILVKWKATFELKAHFDQLAGVNIYTLLPNIVENTIT